MKTKMGAEQLRKLIVRIEDMIGYCEAHSGTFGISDALDEALECANDQLSDIEAGTDGEP